MGIMELAEDAVAIRTAVHWYFGFPSVDTMINAGSATANDVGAVTRRARPAA
jgi:hypothetical protein